MRVLFIGQTYVIPESRKKLTWLAQQPGLEVSLIVPARWRIPGLGAYRFSPAPADSGIQIYPLPVSMSGRVFGFVYEPLSFRAIIRQTHPDIIQAEQEPGSLALLEAAGLGRRPGGALIAFSWENYIERQPTWRRLLEQWQLPRLRHLLVGNAGGERIFRGRGYQGPLSVLPNAGLDATLFAPRPQPELRAALGLADRFVVGFAGRLALEKGVHDLLAAFSRLPPTCHLLFLGGGPERTSLAATAEALGLTARITFQPTVPHDQVYQYLNCMDCLVLPSRTLAGRWQEQFGLVLAQAMACEVPVIGSASGAIPEVIGEAGLTYPEGDVAGLTACLHRFLTAPDLAQALGQQGRTRVLTCYTHEHIARQTLRVHEQILNGQ